MSKDFTLHRVPFVHLYRDLSFEDFFGRYDPWRDGKVTAATYSFSHKDFGFWAKLLPNSVIYVDQKYEATALEFLKRYPWFEVRLVPRLHSKVILFEKSGVLLVGSENLYASSSSFSEVMIATIVPDPTISTRMRPAGRQPHHGEEVENLWPGGWYTRELFPSARAGRLPWLDPAGGERSRSLARDRGARPCRRECPTPRRNR